MAVTLTDAKRAAIAEKLADMRAVQNLLIANERQFIQECSDNELCERLEDMLEDDQKNLGILETSITQYGVQSKPKEKVQQMIQQIESMMKGSTLTLYEKVVQHELLKHGQVMSGLVVHKAAQVVGPDVQQALAPINTINFENRAHQEQLKGWVEYLGTYELTGQEPGQGLGARLQDAIAAMTGVFGSAVTQSTNKSDMDITNVIFMDHQKAKTLMREIRRAKDANKAREYFGQLYADLIVHSKAEEETVYPAVRPFYGEDQTQHLYDEQAELAQVLNEMKSMNPTSPEFLTKLDRVKNMVEEHTSHEENRMFSDLRNNFSEEQREQMATRFKEAKKQLQSKM